MSHNQENQDNLDVAASKQVRRTFLKRASAGAVIASIPGRTAWAGILNSIVASGHGSDFSDGECMQVLSPGYWVNHTSDWGPVLLTTTFNDAFGGEPLFPKDTTPGRTLLEVLQRPGNSSGKLGGPNNVNFFLVSFYLMAANHGSHGIHFPVLGVGQPFPDLDAYADYLYAEAVANPGAVGTTLSDITNNYHYLTGDICPL